MSRNNARFRARAKSAPFVRDASTGPRVAMSAKPSALLILACLGLRCAADNASPPIAPDCPADADCTPRPTGGGSGTGTGGTGGAGGATDAGGGSGGGTTEDDGDAGTLTVSYAVRATVDGFFFAAANYGGAVKVRAIGPGNRIADPSDGGVPLAGMLAGVAPGLNWFAVEDGSSLRRIVSTLQPALVDANVSTLDLRAISTDGLSSIVVDQVVWSPPVGTATVILNFRRQGRALAGVSLQRDALPTGTTVAYDSSGSYVSDGMVLGGVAATESQGVAIVREIPGTVPFPALSSITFRYTLAKSTSTFPAVEAKLARDMVTSIVVEVP